MTLILVDPFELNVASETLRSCAVETADIGTELWACAQCAMPAEVDAAINNIVTSADRVLDFTASHLQVRATDLAQRAAIAANDPLTAASVVTNIVGGNFGPGLTVSASDPFGGMTIGGVDSFLPQPSSQSILGGVATIGGGDSFLPQPSTQSILGGVATIGGGDSFLPQPSTQSILGGVATIGGGDPYGGVTYLPAGSLVSGPGIIGPATLRGIPGSSPLTSALFSPGMFGGSSTTPFLGSGDDSNPGRLPSWKEWSNDMTIDTDKDGTPNGADTKFKNFDPH